MLSPVSVILLLLKKDFTLYTGWWTARCSQTPPRSSQGFVKTHKHQLWFESFVPGLPKPVGDITITTLHDTYDIHSHRYVCHSLGWGTLGTLWASDTSLPTFWLFFKNCTTTHTHRHTPPTSRTLRGLPTHHLLHHFLLLLSARLLFLLGSACLMGGCSSPPLLQEREREGENREMSDWLVWKMSGTQQIIASLIAYTPT